MMEMEGIWVGVLLEAFWSFVEKIPWVCIAFDVAHIPSHDRRNLVKKRKLGRSDNLFLDLRFIKVIYLVKSSPPFSHPFSARRPGITTQYQHTKPPSFSKKKKNQPPDRKDA